MASRRMVPAPPWMARAKVSVMEGLPGSIHQMRGSGGPCRIGGSEVSPSPLAQPRRPLRPSARMPGTLAHGPVCSGRRTDHVAGDDELLDLRRALINPEQT